MWDIKQIITLKYRQCDKLSLSRWSDVNAIFLAVPARKIATSNLEIDSSSHHRILRWLFAYYISKMKEHLDDKNAYKKLTRNEDKHILKGVKKNSHTETLSVWKEENLLLNKFESKTSYFCGLPKIHQS